MGEQLSEERLEACLAILESAAIRSQTEVGCGRQIAVLREVEAELRSLRAECEDYRKATVEIHPDYVKALESDLDDKQNEIDELEKECERLKSRQVPNLDAMSLEELRVFHLQLDTLDGYQFARRRVLADKVERSIEAEQWYAALPPWAKFREE